MISDDEQTNTVELHPKRTTSFTAQPKKKTPVEYDLAMRIVVEREKTKYWARILLLFPLAPVCLALATIVFGGVIINVASSNCNADLIRFMQGAVVLSHVLVCFYTYCWMGPWPIKSLRTVRVFYVLYGVVCVAWWGIYGTLQAMKATSSGFESCLSMSPTLYIFSQYEVISFWVVFIAAVAFFFNEKTASTRQSKLDQWAKRKEDAKRVKQLQEAPERVLRKEEEETRELKEEERPNISTDEQELYGSDDGEEGNDDGVKADGQEEADEQNLDDIDEYGDDSNEQHRDEETL